jgi:hypothetical protein
MVDGVVVNAVHPSLPLVEDDRPLALLGALLTRGRLANEWITFVSPSGLGRDRHGGNGPPARLSSARDEFWAFAWSPHAL